MSSVDMVRAVAGAAALVISGVAVASMVASFIVKVVRCVRWIRAVDTELHDIDVIDARERRNAPDRG